MFKISFKIENYFLKGKDQGMYHGMEVNFAISGIRQLDLCLEHIEDDD